MDHLAFDDAGGAQRHGFGLIHERERMHRALDRAERIAQLVRQHGEEFVLGAVLALRSRQRADVAEDQRAMFDIVEHDARQRDLDFGGFLSVEHQPRLVAAGAVFEHGAQDFAFGRRQELADRSAEDLLERHAHQVGEALVAVDDVAGEGERGRAFLHALDQRAIGRVGAAQREHAPLAVFVGEQQRVDLAAVDGLQVALRLEQARAQFLEVEVVDVHAGDLCSEARARPAAARDSTCRRSCGVAGAGRYLDERRRGEDLLIAGSASGCWYTSMISRS